MVVSKCYNCEKLLDKTHCTFNVLQPFERTYIDNPGPLVVFATPGMLHGGLSLQIFRKWCTDANNMVRLSLSRQFSNFYLCSKVLHSI